MPSSNTRLSTTNAPSLALKTSYDAEVNPLLTTIDQIRNRIGDIDATIELPAIVVIGEQSSGKSSVLEALSGIPLPRGGQRMTTKCPLELRMRQSPTWHASLESAGRVVRDNIAKPSDVGQYINQEQNKLTNHQDKISKQSLLLNVQADWLPNLTLIDLPGIIQVTSKQQDSTAVDMIEDLIQDYLERPGTIILAIIQACNDIETSAAIKYARMYDPEGERTIGVLTKLDLVDRGVEQKILEIFENKRIPLKLGYLMVKCRTQEDIDNNIDLAEALRKEEQFFAKSSKFQSVPVDRRGCPSLARFLSRQLISRIKNSIPQLLSDLRQKMTDIEHEFRQLGIDDYKQLLVAPEARSRYLTEKLFSAMQQFRTEIHLVEEGAQVNNPLYAKRNELNQQFYRDMHQCKFDHQRLIHEIRTAMIATQGPEPSDYILFRVTKTVCLHYVKAIRKPMEKYLSDMLERTNYVILQVINKVFHTRPNLLLKMRDMHQTIERKLKEDCQRELDLIIEMEQSFVYADNPLYKETLRRTKKLHKPDEAAPLTTTTTHQIARLPLSSTTTAVKRNHGAISEDNDDEGDTEYNPPVKISRSGSSTTPSRFASVWDLLGRNSRQETPEPLITTDLNVTRPVSDYVSSARTVASTEAPLDEEIFEYKVRILAMQDIICQRIVLTFPQRIEYQLVRKQFSSLDLESSILISTNLEQLDTLMASDPQVERKQNELITKRTLYEESIKELQNLEQH